MADGNDGRLDLQDVLSRVNIVSLISQYVPLKKQGANYVGLCPFHGDRNPSMFVSEQKQIFKCFSCGVGGNAIRFVQLADKLTFQEALYKMADDLGIKYTKSSENNEAYTRLRQDIKSVNKEAARFYFEQLKTSAKAIGYLKERRLSPETSLKFGLGYSPDSWDALYRHFTERGVKPELLLKAGLISKSSRDNSYIDRFRDRVMFPIFDDVGNVIGFGGRTMEKNPKTAKYINSQETPVYTKGEHLYGLNIAKKTREQRVLVVEGYMDCIALHQKGIDFAVASLGTALTERQARLLKKYFTEVIVAFDNDGAGKEATVRGMEILKKTGLSVKVFRLQGAKDADEYLKTHSKEDFLRQLESSYSLFEYKCILASEQYPPTENENKIRFIDAAKDLLRQLPDTDRLVYRSWLLNQFAKKYGFSESMLEVSERTPEQMTSEETRRQTRIFVDESEYKSSHSDDRQKKNDYLEKSLLITVSENPGIIAGLRQDWNRELFGCPDNQTLFDAIMSAYREGSLRGVGSIPSCGAAIDNDLAGVLMKFNVPRDNAAQAAGEIVSKLKKAGIEREIGEVSARLARSDVSEAEKKELKARWMDLIRKKKSLP